MNFNQMHKKAEIITTLKSKILTSAKLFNFKELNPSLFIPTDLIETFIPKNLNNNIKDSFEKYFLNVKLNDKISLRPEATLFILNEFLKSEKEFEKLFYCGPMFRSNSKGELNHFKQFGAEIIGGTHGISEITLMMFGMNFLKSIGFNDIVIEIGSVGCSKCSTEYIKNLSNFVLHNINDFCTECMPDLEKNPTKVFHCSAQFCAPNFKNFSTKQFLCESCVKEINDFEKALFNLSIPFRFEPLIKHGFGYYNELIFNFATVTDNKKVILGGGGRYDDLVKNFTDCQYNASGFSFDLDKMVDILKNKYHSSSFFNVLIGFQNINLDIHILQIYKDLLQAKIPTELFEIPSSKNDLITYAKKNNFKSLLFLDTLELRLGKCIVYDLFKEEESTIYLNEIQATIQRLQSTSIF